MISDYYFEIGFACFAMTLFIIGRVAVYFERRRNRKKS